VFENFQELKAYRAAKCQIRSISKENFQNLWHLKALVLGNNEVETIQDDVFEDLIAIIYLDLSMIPASITIFFIDFCLFRS
jgi:Leucine rich repeat